MSSPNTEAMASSSECRAMCIEKRKALRCLGCMRYIGHSSNARSSLGLFYCRGQKIEVISESVIRISCVAVRLIMSDMLTASDQQIVSLEFH